MLRTLYFRLGSSFCVIIFLLSAGCTKKVVEENPQTTSIPVATVANENVVSDSTNTPEATLSDTLMDTSPTPEVSATTSPIILGDNEFQNITLDFLKSLSKNFTEDYSKEEFSKSFSDDKVFSIIKGLFGVFPDHFLEFARSQGTVPADSKKIFFSDTANFTNELTIILADAFDDMIYDNDETKYSSIGIYNILVPYSNSFPGIEILKILEDIMDSLSLAIETNNDDDFLNTMEEANEIITAIYNNEAFIYNGSVVTDYEDMHPTIKILFISESRAILITGFIKCFGMRGGGDQAEEFRQFSNSLSLELDRDGDIANDFYKMMDEYVALQLEIEASSNSPEPIYTPTPIN